MRCASGCPCPPSSAGPALGRTTGDGGASSQGYMVKDLADKMKKAIDGKTQIGGWAEHYSVIKRR